MDWRDQAKVFEHIAAYAVGAADLIGSDEPERLTAGYVSADLFATLGVYPALGRAFATGEDMISGEPVVILSHNLWRRRFGGDPKIIGGAITLGGKSRTVIGIMPPEFKFPEKLDLWAPLSLDTPGLNINVIARLKPGVTPEAINSDISVIVEQQRRSQAAGPSARTDPDWYTDVQVRIVGLRERLVGDVRQALLTLFGAVAFVLLIACANVANLLLTSASVRHKEMAIRMALGAGRIRLARQLLTESLLLSLTGAAAGVLLAVWGVKLVVAMNPGGIPGIDESIVDGRALGFTCAIAVLTGLLAGMFPALQATRTNVNEPLKARYRALGAQSGRRSGSWSQPALIIAEFALTMVLLVGAGLMIKSFMRLLAVPTGFNSEGVLTLTLSPSDAKYPIASPQRGAYFEELLARVQALPGIQSASLTGFLPLVGPSLGMGFQIEGRQPFPPGREPVAPINLISPEYFRTMGMQLRAGRPFTSQDGPGSPPVAIINETLARRHFPNETPIGHRLLPLHSTPKTIVGLAPDTRHFGLDREVEPEIYAPYSQNPNFGMSLVARAVSDRTNAASLDSLSASIRNQVRAQEPNEPVDQILTMERRLSDSVAPRRFRTALFGAFAAIALVLAAVGAYGVISHSVSRRTHEIGIRMALGASPHDVLLMIVRHGMSLALAGVAIGLVAAFALTRVMTSLLFNVKATDPTTFGVISLLLISVALIAAYLPARRATKVDPMVCLRHE